MRIRAHTIRTSQFDDDFDLELSDAAHDFAESIPDAPAAKPKKPIQGWPVDEMGNPFSPVVGMSYSWKLTPEAPPNTITKGKLTSCDDNDIIFQCTNVPIPSRNRPFPPTERLLSPSWIDAITAHEVNEANPWKTLAELGEPEKGVEYELRLRGNPPPPQWSPTGNIVAEYEGRIMGGGPGTRMIFRSGARVAMGVEENNLLFIRPHGSATPAISSSPENTSRQENAIRSAARTLYEGFVNSSRGERALARAMELRYPDTGTRANIEDVVAAVAEAAAQWFYNDTHDEESIIAGARGWDALSNDFVGIIREDLLSYDRSRSAVTKGNTKLAQMDDFEISEWQHEAMDDIEAAETAAEVAAEQARLIALRPRETTRPPEQTQRRRRPIIPRAVRWVYSINPNPSAFMAGGTPTDYEIHVATLGDWNEGSFPAYENVPDECSESLCDCGITNEWSEGHYAIPIDRIDQVRQDLRDSPEFFTSAEVDAAAEWEVDTSNDTVASIKPKLLKEAMAIKDITATSFALKSFLTLPRGLKDSISLEDWLTPRKGSLRTAQRLAAAFGRPDPKTITPYDLKALQGRQGAI